MIAKELTDKEIFEEFKPEIKELHRILFLDAEDMRHIIITLHDFYNWSAGTKEFVRDYLNRIIKNEDVIESDEIDYIKDRLIIGFDGNFEETFKIGYILEMRKQILLDDEYFY